MTKISLPGYLSTMTGRLEQQLQVMSSTFEAPRMTNLGAMTAFRYSEKSDTLLCFLKGVKLVSTLNAAISLVNAGYAQEMSVLIRVADGFDLSMSFSGVAAIAPHHRRPHTGRAVGRAR
jgi:hypothetical protein